MSDSKLWMPLYLGDYLADTQRLTTEQHGAYLLLLMDYWRNGPPPADDAVLSSISRLKSARFRKHKSTLLSLFTVRDGKLHHKRVDVEKAKAEQHAKRRSEKASKAANARWQGINDDAPSNAPSNARSNAPECPIPSPSVTNVTAASGDPGKFIFSEGLALLKGAGASEQSARTFLGKLRSDLRDDPKLARLIGQCISLNIGEPRAWLTASCKDPSHDLGSLCAAVDNMTARKAAQG